VTQRIFLFLVAVSVWLGSVAMAAQERDVSLQVTVTDTTGAFVQNLHAGDFVVSIDKTKLVVREVRVKSDTGPVDISLVIDTSVIAGKIVNPLVDIMQSFVNRLRAEDQMALVAYDSSANLVQDFTASHRLLLDAVRGLKYGNGAALLDAIYATADGGYANSTAKRVMVLLSTGIDTGSQTKMKDVAPLLQKQRITLYAISLGRRNMYAGNTSEIFDKLTVATGGRAFYPRRAPDIAGIVNQVMGGAGGREFYELIIEAPIIALEEAQKKLRVQVDRGLKEDKSLEITARLVTR